MSKPQAICKSDQVLINSEVRYRRLFETAQDGILILDGQNGAIQDVNPFLMQMLGYSHKELVGKKLWEIGLFQDIAESRSAFETLLDKGYVRYDDLPLETKGGKSAYVEFVSNTYKVDEKKVIQCNIRDITKRKKAEILALLSVKIMERLSKPGTIEDLIRDLLLIIKKLSQCESIGLRLNDGNKPPVFDIYGFIEDHFGLIGRDSPGNSALECSSGNIISGLFDPSMPFPPENNSFWTNSVSDYYLSPVADKYRIDLIRGLCGKENYESFALIPLKTSKEIIGILQISSVKRDRFNPEMIKQFESIGQNIGIVLQQKRADEALKISEGKYRGLVNNVKLGIFRSTPGAKGTFLEVNKAMEQITGYSRKELLKMPVSGLYMVPSERSRFIHRMGNSRKSFKLEFKLKRKDKSEIAASVTDTLIRDNNGKVIYLDGILEDISERQKLAARTLEIAALKQINIAKSDLLANVSHELRTPLTTVKGFIESLLETDVKWSKKQQIDFLQSANVEVDRLVFMISDLLVMSSIDSGRMVLNKQPSNLKQLLDSAGSVLSRIAIKHRLKIEIAEDLPQIQVDKLRIAQVITNMTENATKFAPEGSQILIAAARNNDDIIFSVEDQGIGMPPGVVTNLFNRFYQAKQVVAGKTKGTGLGLAICKGIVEAHGGRIWVDSQEGKGSKFFFTIPVVKL